MHLRKNNPVFCFHRWSRKGYAIFASLHRVVKIGVVTFGCTLTQLNYQPILAQAQDSSHNPKEVHLSEIEVSGDQPLVWSQLTHAVSVMERSEINASPARSLDDMLEQIAGLDIRQRGSDGVQADLSIRGGSFDQVLILLNGVNITDPQTGHYSLDLPVDLQQIQRIEILQGSGARIWGSNAFSGVINIITTPEPTQQGKQFLLDLSGGSFGYFSGTGSAYLNRKSLTAGGSASYKHSDGYRENTDFDLFNSHIQVSYRSEHLGGFSFQSGYQQKSYGANSFYSFAYPNQYEQTKTLFTALNWEKKAGKNFLQAQLYNRLHHDRFELFRNGENAATWYTGHNYHLTDVSGGTWKALHPSTFGKTIVGIDIRNEHILSNVLGEALSSSKTDIFDKDGLFTKKANRTNYRVFADQTVYLDALTLSAGLSGNYHSDFGSYFYGGMDANYRITENVQASFGLNQSFRLPTFTDLYYKSATQSSNPDLKPEKSTTYELGLTYKKHAFSASAVAFYRAGKNVIDWVKQPDSTKWVCRNETALNTSGADLTAEYQTIRGFLKSLRLSWSGLYMHKTATGYDSKYALDYLRTKINLHLEHAVFDSQHAGSLSATWNCSWQDRAGTYTDYTTNALKKYAPYFLTDIRLAWHKKNTGLYTDVNNLFNTSYADLGGLTQPGRSIRAGLKLQF
jgi:vitamin B12 transporter